MARRKRSHIEGPHDNEERWLLTYSDLITLLFVLFVVMYAISTTDVRKLTVLAQSLSAAFNADVMQGQQAISIDNGQNMDVQTDTSSSSRISTPSRQPSRITPSARGSAARSRSAWPRRAS